MCSAANNSPFCFLFQGSNLRDVVNHMPLESVIEVVGTVVKRPASQDNKVMYMCVCVCVCLCVHACTCMLA